MTRYVASAVVLLHIFCATNAQQKITAESARLQVESGQVHVDVTLDLQTTSSSITLYLHEAATDLALEQHHQPVKFQQKGNRVDVYGLVADGQGHVALTLAYTLRVTSSRNISTNNACTYILSDANYLPLLSVYENRDPVRFELAVNQPLQFPRPGATRVTHAATTPPHLVMGVFKTNTFTAAGRTVRFYYPQGTTIDGMREKEVVRICAKADSLFTVYFSPLGDTLSVFFVNRNGGHSLSTRHVMLDIGYVTRGRQAVRPDVIAHEVSHGWWGQRAHSKTPVLTEALAEYSAGLFLGTFDRDAQARFYVLKSVETELDPPPARPLHELTPAMEGVYRQAAYTLLPHLLYQAGQQTGTRVMMAALSKLAATGAQRPITFDDLYSSFRAASPAVDELQYYANARGPYPDLTLEGVTPHKVTVVAKDLTRDRKVPVCILFTDQTQRVDTFLLSARGAWQDQKAYTQTVSDVIIDPLGWFVQQQVANDTWKTDRRLFRKLSYAVSPDYYTLAESFLGYLFSEPSYPPSAVLSRVSDIDVTLRAAAAKIREKGIGIAGYELFIEEWSPGHAQVRVLVWMTADKKKFKGFADLVMERAGTQLLISRIDRLKL